MDYFNDGASGGAKNGSEVSIWAVGELGGGMSYFSHSNMIGLYRELRMSVGNGNVPDHIIFNGEVLPKIPSYITRGGRAESLLLGDYVNDMNDAVVSVRPHLGRISAVMNAAGKQNAITYVMSTSDNENITIKYDLTVYMYNRRPDMLFDLLLSVSDKVAAGEGIIESTMDTIKHYEEHTLAMEEGKRRKMEDRLLNMKQKMQMHEEEVQDYAAIRDKYAQLVRLWFDEHQEMEMDEVLEKFGQHKNNDTLIDMYLESLGPERRTHTLNAVKGEFDDLNAKLEKMRAGEAPDEAAIEEMTDRIKVLAKMITRLGYEETEQVSKTAGREQLETGSGAAIFRFVNMMPGTKSLSVLAQELALSEMQARIRDAFGRRTGINIISEKTGVLEINGFKVLIAYDPVSYSKTVKKEYSQGIQHLINSSEVPINMVISGHSYKAGEEAFPWRDRSTNYVYSVVLPTFIDREKLGEAWNSGHKTPFVSAYGNMPVTSGFYRIKYDGHGYQSEFMNSEYLQIAANREMSHQTRLLATRLARMKPPAANENKVDNKDRLELASKLPSELNSRLVNALLISNGIDPANSEAVAELVKSAKSGSFGRLKHQEIRRLAEEMHGRIDYREGQLRRMNFVVVTDTHIGSPGMGEPTTQLLDGVVNYVQGLRNFGSYSLLLLGDNIEGNLRNHKYEVNMENDQSNVEVFARFLNEKGVAKGTPEYRRRMEEYMALMFERQAIPNIDIQAEKFITLIRPLLRDAELIATVSGNHVNKTHDDKSMDESIKLGMLIEALEGGEKVVRAPGGDFGLGIYSIDGKPFFLIHKPGNPYHLVDREGITATMFAGDAHVFRKSIVGNSFELISPCLQGNNSYAESIGIGVSNSLRGITLTTLIFDEKHDQPVISATKLVTLKELVERGFVKGTSKKIKEFESLRRDISGKSKPVKINAVSGR